MLILTFRPGESVTVAGPCEIVVLDVGVASGIVRVGIDADKHVHIGQIQPSSERDERVLDA